MNTVDDDTRSRRWITLSAWLNLII